MNLKDLLLGKNIDPQHVLVLRHRPLEPELNKVLPWLAAERPDVFNAYQQSQTKQVEREMTRAAYVAAFIFTILQRVSPDMEPDDVIRLESSWKQRLHTRQPYGLNDN